MRKILRNVCVSMLVCSASLTMAQKPVFETIGENFDITAISPNGKWIGLNAPNEESSSFNVIIDCYLYNTETAELTKMESEEGMNLKNAKAISPGGFQVGVYGMDDMKTPAAYYKDNQWNILPVPQDRVNTGSIAFAVSDDATLIGGEIEGVTVGKPALPCLWRLDGEEYKLENISSPEKDATGGIPQGGGVMSMSSDGSVLVGTMWDWAAASTVLIVWKKEGNQYNYKIYGEDFVYNMDEEVPGPCPEYEQYVTAERGTPEYDEQYSIWKPLSEKYFALRDKFYTGNSFQAGAYVSANGRYVVLTAEKVMGSGAEKNVASFPYRIDLQTGEEVFYEEGLNMSVSGVLDDGTVIAFGSSQPIYYANIFPQYSKTPIHMEDWIQEKFGVDVSEEFTYNEGILTGYPFVSADGSVVSGTFMEPDTWVNISYYVREAPSSIYSMQSNDKVSVTVNGDQLEINGVAEEVSLVDLTGKVVYHSPVEEGTTVRLSSLSKGIYLVKLLSGGEVITHKIVY